MNFANEYDIDNALSDFDSPRTPNRSYGAMVLNNLSVWANENSDGWAYWPKPARSAAKLIGELTGGTYETREWRRQNDLTDAELKRVLAPIKAFLTRQGVPHSEVFP